MMKKWMKKFGVVAASAVALTTLVSAGPANADVSRVIYFPIQSNTHCGYVNVNSSYETDYYFNINNISDGSVEATLYFYAKDGTPFTDPGASGSTNIGFSSEIVPGTPITIAANSTVQYLNYFGNKGIQPSPLAVVDLHMERSL